MSKEQTEAAAERERRVEIAAAAWRALALGMAKDGYIPDADQIIAEIVDALDGDDGDRTSWRYQMLLAQERLKLFIGEVGHLATNFDPTSGNGPARALRGDLLKICQAVPVGGNPNEH